MSDLKNDPAAKDASAVPLAIDDEQLRQQASWCYQFKLLAERNFLNMVRLP
jgi:hypothetical protein